MMLLHQFTYISAPHIWSGDELGMWGADDPDCRKPVIWGDMVHRSQVFDPLGNRHNPIPVTPDTKLRSYYKVLISLRKKRSELKFGNIEYVLADDQAMTLAYTREDGHHRSLMVFNFSKSPRVLRLKIKNKNDPSLLVESELGALISTRYEDGVLKVNLNSKSSAALILE